MSDEQAQSRNSGIRLSTTPQQLPAGLPAVAEQPPPVLVGSCSVKSDRRQTSPAHPKDS